MFGDHKLELIIDEKSLWSFQKHFLAHTSNLGCDLQPSLASVRRNWERFTIAFI